MLCIFPVSIKFSRANSRISSFEFSEIAGYQNPDDGGGVGLRSVSWYEKNNSPVNPKDLAEQRWCWNCKIRYIIYRFVSRESDKYFALTFPGFLLTALWLNKVWSFARCLCFHLQVGIKIGTRLDAVRDRLKVSSSYSLSHALCTSPNVTNGV